jgi:acyl-CoA reductase-like NAD-dependent aldehyde dehydrogenase
MLDDMFDHLQPSYFLNPLHVEIARERANPVFDPATLEQVGVVGEPTPRQLDEILDRVNGAQKKWAKMDCKTRAGILHGIAQSIEEGDMTEIAVMMTREIGKPYPESIGEIANIPPVFRYFAEMARDDAGKIADLFALRRIGTYRAL